MEQQQKKGGKTLMSFFKRRVNISESDAPSQINVDTSINDEQPPPKIQRVEFDDTSLVREPGLRFPIWEHSVNQHDEIRRAYIKAGPYQPNCLEFPRSKFGIQYRRFQSSWFSKFPWLEYSPQKDAAFCFPCFIFEKKTANRSTLTGAGFTNWKVVFDAFSMHVGGPNSPHSNAVNYCDDLMNVGRHIDKVMNAQSSEDIQKNRVRLMATIESIRWLTLQGCALRGHDESVDSKNRDEAKDTSNREQMVIVLRFVDVQGFLRERFFHIVHVKDTTALTLKKEISDILTRYNLDIHNM
ncbi:uncharacterized protein LOC131323691 [Rhododendron vialii]|uniref:uncharacterized protein LOC131323691 n=1 Tax=Rhododendron vialii TaxID=182163 RepID=UPI00265FA363|nr:uncharacterized protein LOC131323691 [Rhododendron vialii]